MEINLRDLTPTTMTNIAEYSGDINLALVFKLIQITKIDIVQTKRKRNKIKLPCSDISGSILSLRFMDKTRGIIRTEKEKQFRNSITIDMSLGPKNVSLKLARTTIHMCGMRSLESSKEATQYLFEKLNDAQNLLDFIRDNTNKITILLNWIRNKARVKAIQKGSSDKSIIFPMKIDKFKANDKKYILMLLSYSYYMDDIEEYIKLIEEIVEFKNEIIIREVPDVIKIRTVMRNYNYSLGFKINRWLLREAVNGVDGFIASYNNSTQHHVKVELPFEEHEYENIVTDKKKSKKIKYHSFFIYKSGIVTQSGRKLKYMCFALQRLLKIIGENKEEIMNLSMDFLLNQMFELFQN
jgi:hypothetical protein